MIAVIDMFLILMCTCIAAHSCHLLLLEYAKARLPLWMARRGSIRYMPVASFILSLVVSIIQAWRKPLYTGTCSNEYNINPDIGGIGVLLGLFLPSLVLWMVLISGHWKAEPLGAKELCNAQMANEFM